MKLSEVLYTKVNDLWKEAAAKPFVVEMAKGSLDPELFRYYMLQDYMYLKEYIDILNRTLKCTADPGLQVFLCNVIKETEKETERVHLPNLKKIGISDAEIENAGKAQVIVDYLAYMRQQPEKGVVAGLTALLQCSWVYAFIGQALTEEYGDEIDLSPYKNWFDAYTCKEYIEANKAWIDMVDYETEGISREETDRLCVIFETCARYENRFWDELYEALREREFKTLVRER